VLTPGQAGAVSTLLSMASTRITHPEVGDAIDAGDVQEAAQAFLRAVQS
jgi:hypothetical protein